MLSGVERPIGRGAQSKHIARVNYIIISLHMNYGTYTKR